MQGDDNIITAREFATRLGFSATYGYKLCRDERLVMAPDGKRVLYKESMERYKKTMNPVTKGLDKKHAATRRAKAEAKAAATGLPVETFEPPDLDVADASVGYQEARAIREKFLALEAKRAYEVAIGELRDAKEVEGLAAAAMTELRIRLENLATSLAPSLVGHDDELQVRILLQDALSQTLESAAAYFSKLAKK